MFVGCQPELLARIVRRDERAIYFGERLILSRTTYSSGALHFRRIRHAHAPTHILYLISIGFPAAAAAASTSSARRVSLHLPRLNVTLLDRHGCVRVVIGQVLAAEQHRIVALRPRAIGHRVHIDVVHHFPAEEKKRERMTHGLGTRCEWDDGGARASDEIFGSARRVLRSQHSLDGVLRLRVCWVLLWQVDARHAVDVRRLPDGGLGADDLRRHVGPAKPHRRLRYRHR